MFKAAYILMSCDKATFLLSKQQHTPLSFGNKAHLKFHLLICTACQKFQKQLNFLSANLQQLNADLENGKTTFKLPDDVKLNLQKEINSKLDPKN
jgi:hypothetical protein